MARRPWPRALGALAALRAAVVLFDAGPAQAYPQFQFSSGTARCSQCHHAPAGGGLLTRWGRDEAGDTLSRGGDGSFLHGLWEPPAWLGLGGDFRSVGMLNDVQDPDGVEPVVFPMQADVYLRLAVGAFSLNGTGGLRGKAREAAPEPSPVSRLVSREHYLMWRPGAIGPYLRAGRFFEPYGLRVVEHVTYIRRYLGFNLLEEPYALSGGYMGERWELHATAFAPDRVTNLGAEAWGGALYYERRIGEAAALGGQARFARAEDDTRLQAGAVGKVYIEPARLLLMAEVDVVHQTFARVSGAARQQLAAYLGATFLPIRGLMTAIFLEHFDEDLSVKNLDRDAVGLQVNFLPWAHFELVLLGRLQLLGLAAGGDTARLFMTQIHYYL